MNLTDINNDYIVSIINENIKKDENAVIKYAEDHYSYLIKKVVKNIKKCPIVLLSGPSASGKTTTAYNIRDKFIKKGVNAYVLSFDNFYKNRDQLPIEDGKPNPELIEALELDLIDVVFNQLLENGKAMMPKYDFVTGTRMDYSIPLDIGKTGVIIAEGIHALNPIVSDMLPKEKIYKIYVSPHSNFIQGEKSILTKRETRFLRRMVRDHWARGSSPENTFEMWQKVCEGEDKYIRPLQDTADFKINTTHAYEINIIKDLAMVLLKSIDKNSKYFNETSLLSNKLVHFTTLNSINFPTSSMLREFTGEEI